MVSPKPSGHLDEVAFDGRGIDLDRRVGGHGHLVDELDAQHDGRSYLDGGIGNEEQKSHLEKGPETDLPPFRV